MDKKISFKRMAAGLTFGLVLLAGCDPGDSVGSLSDSLDTIPSFRTIEGAENATIIVNRNMESSYFNIDLGDVAEQAGIETGEYAAWCAQWDIPINSDNGAYTGVEVMDIVGEEYWREVVFLINEADLLIESSEEIGMKEIQVAAWALIKHKKIDLNQDFIDQLGPRFNTTNLQAVLNIIQYVRVQAPRWNIRMMRKYLYYIKTGDRTQDLIITKMKDE